MGIEPGRETPYFEFMTLVHPEDRHELVEALKRQFIRGGFRASTFRLAKPPPFKRLYSESLLELDSRQKPARMTGWIKEVS